MYTYVVYIQYDWIFKCTWKEKREKTGRRKKEDRREKYGAIVKGKQLGPFN